MKKKQFGAMGINYNSLRRYEHTLKFLKRVMPPPCRILDLGTHNHFSAIMQENGYDVKNTLGEDLDLEYQHINRYEVDLVTSFELFEHLLAPFNVLKTIQAPRLVASVPLKNWFASAYWNEKNEWDRHYHEFEPRQFDWLLEKTGWKVIEHDYFTAPVRAIGIRPLLRLFTPRIYIVYCERKESGEKD